MIKSRLTRRTEKQTKRQLYFSLGGIAATLIFLSLFGPMILTFFGSIIDSLQGKNKNQINYLSLAPYQTPTLDSLPQATPSASITITGMSQYTEGQIEVFLNNSSYKEADVDNNNFEIENIRLDVGENTIKIRYKKGDKTSDFSQEQKILLIKDAPKLEISNPTDNSTFGKADQDITISGQTDADNSVKVNEFRAIVDTSGNFSYTLTLKEGENKISVEAQNEAFKTTTKTITVFYKP
ncbi:MAG: hypothetical protein COX79_04385 [Candidatus Levybacteria bacterium CG_4_10_14_0_2_um_filter_36_16]|nr:MAG: hypothetical protein AUK12_02175 [Candidatus Levybacteria bacterium CG2_30_37_29]PIR79388.1 MAG: hypothetical protein COU26_01510 [Candidatus Levybacteria bacterium CG10_big_fil_rev_8_21_14_0_10_36_30]PIZ96806.1 MAG: hypothetical protein COX79_04385 [Candidatus Levybacteria bacterium CG_4_10_14_0_2_um_filter_36_16]PJA90416.1 MAG: hypothetical protein CO136_02135 [Candidatus Levybacteria bacterium CG_4_9_14_3_um_filter_36_7]